MTGDGRIIEGPYLRDLLAQPAALRAGVDWLKSVAGQDTALGQLRAKPYRRVVLTGMGSSYHALYPLHLELCRRGLPSLWVETSELLSGYEGSLDADTLLVAVSQSGQSAETVRLFERRQPLGRTVAVTNNEQSFLAKNANHALLLCAGAESTVSCKTYLNTLAALDWLKTLLCGDDPRQSVGALEQAIAAVGEYLGPWRTHVAALIERLDGVQDVFVTGRGNSLATAGTGGLILKESTHYHAEGMSAPAFRHGPLEMVGPSVFVLAFAGDEPTSDLNRRLVDDVVKAGGRAALAGPQADEAAFRLPEVPASVRPLVEILPVQMISLALAALRGREAGKFERASKVTTIE